MILVGERNDRIDKETKANRTHRPFIHIIPLLSLIADCTSKFANSTMKISPKNVLLVNIKGRQSREKLLTFIQAKQKGAPIRRLDCCIYICEEFDVQHPLFSIIQSTTTLEHVVFFSFSGRKASIDAFLDAVTQNDSIHTVELWNIDCSTYAVQKLMQRKIRWEIHGCRFIGHPSSQEDECSCNVEELSIENDNDPSVINFMLTYRSWPLLRRLSIRERTGSILLEERDKIELDLHYLQFGEHIIAGAPILQELALQYFHFQDPAMFQPVATIVFHSPSPNLKWHLNDCKFHPDTLAVLETIVKNEKAKLMRVNLRLCQNHYGVFRTFMSASSCLGHLDVSYEHRNTLDYGPHGDPILEMLPVLEGHPFSSPYPRTSIHFTIDIPHFNQYREVIDSIPNWTSRVKKLFLRFEFGSSTQRPSFRMKLKEAVRNNLHLQSVGFEVNNRKNDDDEKAKNADKRCRAWLQRYCERNRKLQSWLNKAHSIPLNIWPYVLFHLTSRGGADMLYHLLRQNVEYILDSGRGPSAMQKKSRRAGTRSHASTAAKRKRKRA